MQEPWIHSVHTGFTIQLKRNGNQDQDVTKWITTNTVTLYDKYGQELENKDALDRYSGAIFVFNGQLPGAVANNAMNREIFYESFEDVKFRVGCSIQSDSCNLQGLRENTTGKPPATVSNSIKHTGNYAAIIPPSGLSLFTNTHEVKANSINYLTPNSKRRVCSRTRL